MPLKYNGTQPTEIKYNGTSLTDVKYGSTVVWRKRTVTYYSETGTTRTATYIEGQAISLSSSYAFSKSGYSFVGWRQDRSASSSVISSLTMGSSNVSLYAVYRKSITVTYYNNSTSATSTSGYQYYNTGNVTNPSFKLTQSSRSGWNARGWSTSTAANGSISYNNGATFTRDSNITLRGMYQKTVTLSYNGNGATGGSTASQSGTAYYNSGSNSTINPRFTVRSNGFSRTNYKFVNWRLNSASGTAYNAGSSITLGSNSTMYASWTIVYTTSTLQVWGNRTHVWNDGLIPILKATSQGGNSAHSISGNTLTANQGACMSVKCNCACTVSTSGTLCWTTYGGNSDFLAWQIYVYKNGSQYMKLLDGGNSLNSGQLKTWSLACNNIVCNAGDTVEVRFRGGLSDRASASVTIMTGGSGSSTFNITGVPR